MKKAFLVFLAITGILLTTACHTIEVQVVFDDTTAQTEAAAESEAPDGELTDAAETAA